jgi:predicted short-subunit dehydrogenase-like oxidoreductase (DUF2520 family)
MTPFPSIFLLGSGNVAWHLSAALAAKGCRFLGVYSRTGRHAEALAERLQCAAVLDLEEAPRDADVYLICTSDEAIAPVSALLPENDGLVVHVSGSVAMDAIDEKHARRGVMYPLQTFNKSRAVDMTDVPVFIEADSLADMDFLKGVAGLLSEVVIPLKGEERKMLHLAAVFSCNFTNFMYGLAAEIMDENGMDFQLLLPLILETAQRMENTTYPMSLQTGPAVRNDVETIRKHLALLENHPDLQELYQILTQSIREHAHGIK